MKLIKPPLGIMPSWIWVDLLEVPSDPSTQEMLDRIKELKNAVLRTQAWTEKFGVLSFGPNSTKKWIEEIDFLTKKLRNCDKEK